MSEKNREIERVEHWLTRGLERTFKSRGNVGTEGDVKTRGGVRTRSGVKTRGGAGTRSGVRVDHTAPLVPEAFPGQRIDRLLEQLMESVSEVPWVIVVDGKRDAFADKVCQQANKIRRDTKFWVVDGHTEHPAENTVASFRLNPENEDDRLFLENLVADLVIVSVEPKDTHTKRVRRWLFQARYILTKKLVKSQIKKLRTSKVTNRSMAKICIVEGGEGLHS